MFLNGKTGIPDRAVVLYPLSVSPRFPRVCRVLAKKPCLPIKLAPLCQERQLESKIGDTPLGRQLAPLTFQEDTGPGTLVSGAFVLQFARQLRGHCPILWIRTLRLKKKQPPEVMRQIDGRAGLLPSRPGPEMTRTVQVLLRPSFPAAASLSCDLQLSLAMSVRGCNLCRKEAGPRCLGSWP